MKKRYEKLVKIFSLWRSFPSVFKAISILFAAGFLACAVWFVSLTGDFFGMGISDGKEVMVNIPAQAGLSQISDILKDEGIIRHPSLFKLVGRFGDRVFQQGGHLLGTAQSYHEILDKLTRVPEVSPNATVSVLIPEGYELRQIADKLEEMGLADKEEFLWQAENGEFDFDFIKDIKRTENRLEGYLFPATYEIFVGESEYDIINRMLSAFEARILPIYEAEDTEFTLDEMVTLASIVEREAANDSERGKVSSVFHNRLKMGMALGSCATVQYIIKERKPVLSNSDIKIESPYNTYINKGLPIGPVASPGEASFRAAVQPDDTDYLYFAARQDGSENVFSKTNEEHLRTVQALQGSGS